MQPHRRLECRNRSDTRDRTTLAQKDTRRGKRPVVPKRPRDAGAVLARLDDHGRHRFPARAEALQIFVVRQRNHGQRPKKALRCRPLLHPPDLAHGVGVIPPSGIVQGAVEQHIIGSTTGYRVDGDGHRPGDLADAIEAGNVTRGGAQVLGQPCGRDDADAVFGGSASRARQQARAHEPVDLLKAQAGVGDGGARGVDR